MVGGSAVLNKTAYWRLVDDNEDGDIYPDIKLGNLIGVPRDNVNTDLDGIWLGQDADNDGPPDTNRNLNRIPDYQEPFNRPPLAAGRLQILGSEKVAFDLSRSGGTARIESSSRPPR